MSCDNVITVQDLETDKKHSTFYREVITGKAGGTGADIDSATNAVTGQTQATLPKVLSNVGFSPAGFDFTTGGTLTERDKAIFYQADGNWYSWGGALPKVVPPASSPASAGGIADNAWNVSTSAFMYRDWEGFTAELLAQAGIVDDGLPDELGNSKRVEAIQKLIFDSSKHVLWNGFAGGADPTGFTNSDAAFASAASYGQPVRIPDGVYLLSSDVVGDFVEGTSVTYSGAGRAIVKKIGFWTDLGPVRVHRIRDRIFVGNAAYYDGAYSPVYSSFLSDAAGYDWLERSAQAHVCHQEGGSALVGSSRTSDKGGTVGQTCIGVAGYAWADDSSGSAWGGYIEAVRSAGVTKNAFGLELTAKNLGDSAVVTSPYNIFSQGSTIGLWLGAGGDGSILPSANAPSSSAIVIGKNGERWMKGLQFQNTGIFGTDGDGAGSAVAIEFARGHRMEWRHSALSGDVSGGFYCDNGLKAQATYGAITLNGFEVRGKNSDLSGELTLMRVLPNQSAANFFEVRAGSSGGRPNLAAQGLDVNIDLVITPKGTGTVRPAGSIAPHVTNALTCGTATNAWSGGFTQTAFTVTSDEREKTKPIVISDQMLDAISEVDWCMYKYLGRVGEKGVDGARWHFGAIAQRCVEAFERHGLNAHEFGFICYDEWDAQPAVVSTIPPVFDANGNEIEPERTEVVSDAVEAGSRYGIRYEEALALEAALQRRNYQRLLARIEALEDK